MINFFGPVNNLGVGVHNYNLAKAYSELGNEICLIPPFGGVAFRNDLVDKWLANRAKFKRHDPSIMIFDVSFLTQFSGIPKVGFAVFETSRLDPVQLASVKSCDFVLTTSEWGRRMLAEQQVHAEVVNEGVDTEKFKVSLEPHPDYARFRFLSVGKLEKRKGTLQTIRCFFAALEREDADLVLHCENQFLPDMGVREVQSEIFRLGFAQALQNVYVKAGLRVILSGQVSCMSALYLGSDCGVFPTAGEGWGLPIHECVASGVPAITGNWTGQSEFLGTEYPLEILLEHSRMEQAVDGVWFNGDRGEWHAVEDDNLILKIRWAFNNARKLRRSIEWGEAVKNARSFTWQRAAMQLDKFLKSVC